ncbi:MAG: hypothetical protein WCI62_00025 [Erysipelotrichaceae bacterium]
MGKWFKLRLEIEYLRFLIKRNLRYVFIMSAAMIVLYPILVITAKILGRTSDAVLAGPGQLFTLILLLFTSFMIPLLVYSYMNSKKNLDVYHALPIRKTDLLLTNLLAGLIILIVPFTIGWFSGGLVSLSSSFTVWDMVTRYLSVIMIATALFTTVMFVLMNCGTSLDTFLYSIVLNFIPLLAWGAYLLFVQTILMGFVIGDTYKIIGMIFPIWALFENGFELGSRLWNSAIMNGFYWLFMALVFATVSTFMYEKRKNEKAESPFTNKWFFPTVSGILVTLFIFFLYCGIYTINSNLTQASFYAPINFVFPFFFTFVMYIVMDAVAQRGFKHIAKAALNFLIVAAIAFSLLLFGIFSRGFGYISYQPKLTEISSVEIKLDNPEAIFGAGTNYMYTYDGYGNSLMSSITLTSPEDIQTVYDMHKIILDEFKWVSYTPGLLTGGPELIKQIEKANGYTQSYVDYPFTSSSFLYNLYGITITYTLDNGSKVFRQYVVPFEWTKKLTELKNSPDALKLITPVLGSMSAITTSKETIKWMGPLGTVIGDIPSFNYSLFKQYYIQDLKSLTDETANALNYKLLGYVNINACQSDKCFNDYVSVDERFVSTASYLRYLLPDLDNPSLDSSVVAALILPTSFPRDMLFHRAYQASLNSSTTIDSILDENQTAISFSYVDLTAAQLALIQPYLANSGISTTATYKVVTATSNTDGSYYVSSSGNLVILPEHMADVTAIISENRLKTNNSFYQIFTNDLKPKLVTK